jgi:hypothetical protein
LGSVFPLIKESLNEAIKRKLSNRDYKMEKNEGSRWKFHMPTWMCGSKSNDVYILELFPKHQIPACFAKNYILTSKGRHHFSVFSKEK